ncbi:MAG: DJ-1/PfpI family protein [Andreesenia angusta]|nr:DJ-1/PfpI family protein [Andreesenia angusta]
MRALVFLAEGFEEIEALTTVDFLRRMKIKVDMVSIDENLEVKGAHDIRVIADLTIDQIDEIDSLDAVIIPGGLPGAFNLRDDKRVIEIVKSVFEKGKLVSAICAGPSVLQEAKILKGRRATCYPGFESNIEDAEYTNSDVEIDSNIITGKGPYLAADFAIEIVRYLLGNEKASELEKDVLKS